jgi:hypothetical protein
MLANDTFRAQMGIAPVIAVAGRFLLPWLIGGGVLYAGAHLLKDELGIQPKRIPLAALLGGIGAGAYVISDALPEGVRPFAWLATIAGVAGSIYVLFLPPPDEPTTPPTPDILPDRCPAAEEIPNIGRGALIEKFEIELDPEQARTGGTNRSEFTSQDYAFAVRNKFDRAVCFYAALAIYRQDGRRLYMSPIAPTDTGVQMFSVPAGAPKSFKLRHPQGVVPEMNVGVTIEIFRTRADAERTFANPSIGATLSSSAIGVRYTLVSLR